MQPGRFGFEHLFLVLAQVAVMQGHANGIFKCLAIESELVGERRCQQTGRDRENANPEEGKHNRHRPTARGDRGNVAIADAGQRNDRPIDRLGNVFELVRLSFVLEQIAKTCGQNHQQDHHESGCVKYPPLADHHLAKRIHRTAVTGELEQTHQPEYAKESQIEEVMEENLKEERQHRQQVNDGVAALCIIQS